MKQLSYAVFTLILTATLWTTSRADLRFGPAPKPNPIVPIPVPAPTPKPGPLVPIPGPTPNPTPTPQLLEWTQGISKLLSSSGGHGLKILDWRRDTAAGDWSASMKGNVRTEETCLVTIEHTDNIAGIWTPFETQVAPKFDHVPFEAPAFGDRHFYRFRSKDMPVEVQTESEVLVKITSSIRAEWLVDFLGADWGIKIEPANDQIEDSTLSPTSGFVSLTSLGFNVLDQPVRLTAGPAVLQKMPWLKAIQIRPKLHGISTNASGQPEPVESASTFLLGNYKVPMVWTIANKKAKKARWVIQRVPFSDPDRYTPPAEKSVFGSVGIPKLAQLTGGAKTISFTADFKTQAVYGIEPPQPFFMRLYEQNAAGDFIGLPSNTFVFVVREEPPELPNGELRFSLYKIKCHETTGGAGDDDLNWKVIRVRFRNNKVECKTMSSGSAELGSGEYVRPKKRLYHHYGPSDLPDVENVYFIHCLRERDGFAATGTSDENLSIIGTGMLQLGKSRNAIMNRLRAEHAADYFHGPPDAIGTAWFKLRKEDLQTALGTGKAKRTSTMTGDSSKYTSRFHLEWFPH